MLYEKIMYYRKKNGFTQEQLADRLNVSRQTITKWESGLVIPTLDYLIELSEVFGVLMDHLVKDSDCESEIEAAYDHEELIDFLIEAKLHTYTNSEGKTASTKQESIDYAYAHNDYKYHDCFVGSSMFSGQEVVYHKDVSIFSMNYYGRVLDTGFNGDFLKMALREVKKDNPFRGPRFFGRGEYSYVNECMGDTHYFNGKEIIFYQNKKIYECVYHGGLLL